SRASVLVQTPGFRRRVEQMYTCPRCPPSRGFHGYFRPSKKPPQVGHSSMPPESRYLPCVLCGARPSAFAVAARYRVRTSRSLPKQVVRLGTIRVRVSMSVRARQGALTDTKAGDRLVWIFTSSPPAC